MGLISLLLAVVACTSLMGLFGLATAQVTVPLWRHRPALALPCAILGACLMMWAAFLVTWLAPPAGPYFAHFAAVFALAYCLAKRSWRLLTHTAPIAFATAGVGLTYVGLMYLWRSGVADFSLASTRFVANRTPMPADHLIPNLFASRIRAGESTHLLIGDWNGSDRPPLQSGWILLNDSLFSRLGFEGDVLPFAAGVVAQLLWVPAVYALLRAVGVGSRSSLIAVLFTAATGTLLTYTIYTWPKLLSAALVCLAMALLIDTARRRGGFVLGAVLAAVLFALAMLAHSAAALTLPAVGALGLLMLRGQSVRTKVLTTMTAAATAVAVYAPWTFFQRFSDPPGDRLLKWHLAGVVPIDGRSVLEALIDSYSRISLADYLAARWLNLTTIINLDLGVGLGPFSEAGIGDRRAHEFFDTSIALGLGMPLVVLMGAILVVHRFRTGELPPMWRGVGWLVVLMLPCIALWSLVFFAGGTTTVNAGSHLWIVILLAAPAAWLASVRPWLAALACLAHLLLVLAVYVPFFGVSGLRISGAATLCLGLVILGGTAWWAFRSGERVAFRSRVA